MQQKFKKLVGQQTKILCAKIDLNMEFSMEKWVTIFLKISEYLFETLEIKTKCH